MARIRPDCGSGRSLALLPHQTFGRAPDCRLRDNSAYVSHVHAELRWNGNRWQVQDLGSRNGTWVDGRRLSAGVAQVVGKGSLIAIGRPENRWELVDDLPPTSMALRADGRLVEAVSGLLALPSSDDPVITIYKNPEGDWVVDTEEGSDSVTDGDKLIVQGKVWTIHLPEDRVQTITRIDGAPTPTNIRLVIEVAGGEILQMSMLHEGRTLDVQGRASQGLLIYLAEQRLADKAARRPKEEQGWRNQVKVQILLDLTGNALNVAIFRLRQTFAKAGLTEASGVIERRNGPRELRLGIADVKLSHK